MTNATMDQLISQVADFSKKVIQPVAAEYDKTEAYPEEQLKQLSDMDVLRMPFDGLYGGLGGSFKDFLDVIRIVSRDCASTASILLTQSSMGIWPIYQYGTEYQKQTYMPSTLSGELLCAYGLNELGMNNDLENMETLAVEREDYWELNGAKTFVSHAGKANIYLVGSKTIAEDGTKGYGNFILDAEMWGLTIGSVEEKMGMRALPVASLEFENIRIPKENVLGGQCNGAEQCQAINDRIRLSIAAQAVGIAEGAFDRALNYVSQDRKFGQRLIDLRNTQFKLAEMYTELQATAALLNQIVSSHHADSTMIAMVKLKAGNTAVEVTEMAIQVTGGYGYMRNNDLERYARDAKLTTIYGGSIEKQHEIISKNWVNQTQV
ncbi:acyl-CoA dehydrogenase family protein [Carnobacterium sp. ISL-102]|uniref:acyl-CoA dehydrogenase family protein n=1 Tax=Carnobacterium sp. ISL-102 TaxID=2819142 RepID=UPI001BEC0121|nr:acyl-CoA dehydrogenase family protein [Carnobacterium sp. ISL-102]MBT2733091.1 acyl-CoA dehydrogenase family protein [Carnobacterium sp. ISL-102]